ncbi:MAG: class I SAM-dependent methyltransferase [Xanthobacteraceae bacterium]
MRILSLAGRKISTALTDIRYGAILKGDGGTRFKHLGVTGTVSSGYDVLPSLFAGQVRPDDVLVDVGCGKGRVLNWWLEHYPRHKIYGIEIDPELAHEARQRLHKFPNVTILTGDACAVLPADASLLYLYNPFENFIMQRFVDMMSERPTAPNGLPTRIIYYNSLDAAMFEQAGGFRVHQLQPIHSFASVIEKITFAMTVIGPSSCTLPLVEVSVRSAISL